STGARKHRPEDSVAATVTIPAPSSGPPHVENEEAPISAATSIEADADDGDEEIPSARPTAVPNYDVEALAAATSWEAKLPKPITTEVVPLPLAVPVRRRASVDGAPLRAAFLLSHVDNRMTIGELATCAQIPIADAIESFVLLADLGVIELKGVTAP